MCACSLLDAVPSTGTLRLRQQCQYWWAATRLPHRHQWHAPALRKQQAFIEATSRPFLRDHLFPRHCHKQAKLSPTTRPISISHNNWRDLGHGFSYELNYKKNMSNRWAGGFFKNNVFGLT
jgi:hypothetical protein